MKIVAEWTFFVKRRLDGEQWGVKSVDGLIIIPPTTILDGQDCDLICRTHNARLKQPDGVSVTSIVSSRTMKPMYNFAIGPSTWELDLAAMRKFIDEMYLVLEAGMSDAFIAHFVRERLAADRPVEDQQHMIAGMMEEFRNFRELLHNPPPVETKEEM